MNAPASGQRRSLALKRYDMPLLEASLVRVDLLSSGLQSHLLQVRGTLALFNQQVDDAMRYHWLTFEKLASDNDKVVSDNLERTWPVVFRFAQLMTGQIANALALPDFAFAAEPQGVHEPVDIKKELE